MPQVPGPIATFWDDRFSDDTYAYGLSRGGGHSGEPLEPGFAWSEGMATGFGCLCIDSRYYTDTIGTSGTVGLGIDVEITGAHVTGIGSEQSIHEIVMDLADGGPDGPADADGDGIGLALGDLYQAMYTFDPAVDGP